MATGGALFGNASARSSSKYLVEFRAGKMFMKGKIVHPDKRKGMLYVHQSEDSLMHFCWKDRTTGVVEDDLIIFPDDVEYVPVAQCTTGRVYLLKFKSTSRKMFFWMQEPKSDKDEDNAKKVNEFLNNPPTPGSRQGGGSSGLGGLGADLAGLGGEGDLQSILGNMSQQQLLQLLGGMGVGGMSSLLGNAGGGSRPMSAASDSSTPLRVQSSPGTNRTSTETPTTSSAPRPATAATTGSSADPSPQIQLSDLQNILSTMNVPTTGGATAGEQVNLASALNPESLIPILANADVQQRLIPHLPDGESLPKTAEELRNTVASPQFQQALQSFGAALTSGELGPLMGQFGLPEDVSNAAAAGDIEAFVKAMQAHEAAKESKGPEKMEEDEK